MAETGEVLLWLFAAGVAVIAIAASLYACSVNARKDAILFRDGAAAVPLR